MVGDAEAQGEGRGGEGDEAAVRLVSIEPIDSQQKQEGEKGVHLRGHGVPPKGMGEGQRQRRQQGGAVRFGVARAEQEEEADRPRAKEGGEEVHQPEIVDGGQSTQKGVAEHDIERVIPGGDAEAGEGQGIGGEIDANDLGQDERFGRDHFALQADAVAPGQGGLEGKGIEGEGGQEEPYGPGSSAHQVTIISGSMSKYDVAATVHGFSVVALNLSFPRRRESIFWSAKMDSGLRWNDNSPNEVDC